MRSSLVALATVALPTATALYVNGSVTAPCDSPIYCQGELLHAIELARPYEDSKTFVDKPTIRPIEEVLAAFEELERPIANNTALQEFLETYFGEEGTELEAIPSSELETNPSWLGRVESDVLRNFTSQVMDIWTDLTRIYVGPPACQDASDENTTGCVSSFIPLNRSFVVAGGRFREPYYWDSFWIVEGLLRTEGSFTEIAMNIIENFLDLVDEFGFVPNGARRYYLNRSQPPLLTQMVRAYVQYTNDTSILDRALPLLEKEYEFFTNNRSIDVEAADGQTYTLSHYAVSNNQPRPESYREDYITATNQSYYAESGIIYPGQELNESQQAQLYQNLASGAESGWDYTSRWLTNPSDAVEDKYFPLRSLNTVNIVPVDLNAILYANEIAIAEFHELLGGDDSQNSSDSWRSLAEQRSAAMTALMWNETHYSYFDYNMTSGGQDVFVIADDDATASETEGAPEGHMLYFTPAQFYPFWTGAAPSWLTSNPLAMQRVYARVADMLQRKAGAIPASNLVTGQQWDEPNVWPPLVYILIDGLGKTPATFGTEDPAWIWTQELALNLTQRYVDSAFCTWRVTGGSTPELPQLEGLEPQDVGIMFEKYADNSTNAAGGGGEYEVVEGFGWSNGVLIWAVDVFGRNLTTPDCGNITAANVETD